MLFWIRIAIVTVAFTFQLPFYTTSISFSRFCPFPRVDSTFYLPLWPPLYSRIRSPLRNNFYLARNRRCFLTHLVSLYLFFLISLVSPKETPSKVRTIHELLFFLVLDFSFSKEKVEEILVGRGQGGRMDASRWKRQT